MNHNDPTLYQVSSSGWQLLGELELIVGPDTDHTVEKWLAVILNSLDLGADLRHKVLTSAREVAARAMQAASVIQLKHVHLLVFAPAGGASNGHHWGSFGSKKWKT
jgi:hypothetical protein